LDSETESVRARSSAGLIFPGVVQQSRNHSRTSLPAAERIQGEAVSRVEPAQRIERGGQFVARANGAVRVQHARGGTLCPRGQAAA